MTIYEKLRERGYKTMPEDFYSIITTWHSWYDGNVKNFHSYKVFNGMKHVHCHRYSAGMAKKVSEDWANLLMNEKVSVTLEGVKEQEFFDDVSKQNSLRVKLNEMQELKAALGTSAYIARVTDATVDAETGAVIGSGAKIKLDYVCAESIIPLSWENGKVIECAFTSEKVNGKDKYLYLQIHHIVNGFYDIENVLFRNTNGECSEVPLNTLPEMSNIPAVVHTGSQLPQFVIDRLNIVNNYDTNLPMGIAVFANAIDQLKGVDVTYDSYVNEFILGKKRIIVKPEATKTIDDEPCFDENDLVFYVLPEDGRDGNIIEEVDMSMRTEEHKTGMQDMLNMLSSKCGFGENHYKFDKGNISTATQVVSENSTLFRTIKKHEIILEDVLKELVRIILRMGNQYMNAGLNEDVEISVDFDDSIIEDKEADFQRDSRMLQMGILNAYEFRMKWLNEDEATAKAALPQMEGLIEA